jgi:hypothetical protein
MSFLGGGFDLTAGLQGLQQIGDRFTQLRDELEQSIEDTIRAERFGLPEAEGAAGAAGGEAAGEGWEAPDVGSPSALQAGDADDAPAPGDGGFPAAQASPPAPASDAPLAGDQGSRLAGKWPAGGGRQHPQAGSSYESAATTAGEPGDTGDAAGPQPAPLAQGKPSSDGAVEQLAGGLAEAGAEPPHATAGDAAGSPPWEAAEPQQAALPEAGSLAAEAGSGTVAATATLDSAADDQQPTGSGDLPGTPPDPNTPAELVSSSAAPAQQAPVDAAAASHVAASAADVATAQQEAARAPPQPAQQLPTPTGERPPRSAPSAPPIGGQGGEEEGLEAPALRQLVRQLREALAARERQMERKAEEAAQLAEVAEKLQQRNAELAQGSKDGEAVADLQRCGGRGGVVWLHAVCARGCGTISAGAAGVGVPASRCPAGG